MFVSKDEKEVIVGTLVAGEFFGNFAFDQRAAQPRASKALERCYVQQRAYKSLQGDGPLPASPKNGAACRNACHRIVKSARAALMEPSQPRFTCPARVGIVSNGQRSSSQPFTQKNLADMIGASREMVNRTLRAL